MSTQSIKSPNQEDLPKEQEEEETKPKPEKPQEQSKEDSTEDTATSLPPSSSSAEKQSSPRYAAMSPLQEAAIRLLSEFDILAASDDEKEDTSPQETNKNSSNSASASSTPPTVSAKPSKRPFDDTDKDEDESQGKEKKKKKKKESDGSDTKDKKPKEVKPLEPYLVRLSSDVETEISFLRGSLDYHTDNDVLPFEDSLSLQDFMTNWLHVDVLESDLLEEIKKLKKKFEKVAEKIGSNMNALEPRNRLAFDLAHRIWSIQSEAEAVLDVEPVRVFKLEKKTHGDEGECSRKDQKEKTHDDGVSSRIDQKEMSMLEAETIFLNGLIRYNLKNGRYPFENDNDMADFIRNRVLIDFPVGKFKQMIESLRRKYNKKGRMLKNVGLLGPRERDVFDLAEKIWGNRIGN